MVSGVKESHKTNRLRGQDFIDRYFNGRVIDIGCGKDLVVPHAEPFDIEHGDANLLDELREVAGYDCVHSSHSLEHMLDPPNALQRWWRLVRPGGHMILVVPEEDLYEQGNWPSLFNREHTCTFRLDRETTWSPRSHEIRSLLEALPALAIVHAEVQDHGYDHALKRIGRDSIWSQHLRHRQRKLLHDLSARKMLTVALLDELNRVFFDLGSTVDQTMGSALAQIQIVTRKLE